MYEKVAAEVPGRPDKPYVISARMMEDGRLLSEGIWDSWEALDSSIPERVNAEGRRIQAQLEPISYDGADVKADKSKVENYIVDWETLGSSDMFDETPELEGLDPTEMTDEESIAKWLEAKGLDKLGVKAVRFEKDGSTPRVEFEIPTSAKDAFGKAYGLDLDENLGDGIDKADTDATERYTVDFETLGSSDMFEDIPGLEDEDPTEMSEEESLQKWLEGKGLDKLGVKVVGTSKDGPTQRVTFDIPTKAKNAFGEAYGLNLDENLGDGIDKTGVSGKEIYERRIATGESLDKVAKDLGIPRLEVRRLEAEYGRTLDKTSETGQPAGGNKAFNYDAVKKIALDEDKTGQERYAAVFDGARGNKFVAAELGRLKVNVRAIPENTEVVFTGGDGQVLTLRFPDGSYHILDTGVLDKDNLVSSQNVNDFSAEVNSEFLSGLFEPDGLPYYRGGFIDQDRQSVLQSEGVDTVNLPTEGVIEGTDIRYEIRTGPGQLGGRMRGGEIRTRARVAVEGQIAGLYLTGDTSNLKLPELERNGIWRGLEGGNRSVFFERPTSPSPFAGDPVEDAKKIVAQLNKENRGNGPDEQFVFDQEGYDPATFTFRKKEKIVDSNFYSWDVSVAVPGKEPDEYEYGIRVDEDGTVSYITSDGMYDDASEVPGEIFPIEVVKYMEDYIKNKFPDDKLPPRSEDGDGPDEPPTPPSGGTPPKTPSPSSPQAPALFKNFDVPSGAFQLRTAEYEPEGRVDEKSSDYTDVPKIIATRYTPQELVRGMSQALLGNSSDAAVDEILSANVDDDNDIVDPADLPDNVDISSVNVGTPSGAGQLEFSAGAEFVPAEALYIALYEAGLDPNRVIANIYDSANGNNNNLNKLIEAQGGVPSQEEAELVDDIVQEIRQLKEVSEPGDSPVANEKQTPSPDPLPGALIENIPIDFENPDYYIPNPEAYIPSQPEVDENGYTDNPEIVSTDYEVADLIEQMLSGITDGSGSALLAFDNITVEVPVEAIRDAIQYQGINTNQILLDLKKESNDMSEEEEAPVRVGPPTTGQRQASERPRLQAHSQMIKDLIEQTGGTVDDETADKIRDAIDQENMLDWSEAEDEDIIEAIAEVAGPEILEQAAAEAETPADSADTPRDPSVDEPMPNALTTPVLVYPGPENPGYRPDNTTLDVSGKVMGYGSRIRASRDGATGTVIAVQNIDSRSGDRIPYVRVLFDDGRIAVRSALKVRVTDENAQRVAPVDQVPERPRPLPDVSSRLDAENPSTGAIATDGSIRGVNSLGVLPEALADLANPNARQTDFAQWGERAGEIARAGRERVTLENIRQAAYDLEVLKLEVREAANGPERDQKQEEYTIAAERFDFMVTDAFGMREGVTFGRNEYSIEQGGTRAYVSGSIEEIRGGKKGISLDQAFSIRDKNGSTVGTGGRTITLKFNPDGTSYWSVKNNSLSIPQAKDKKSGFATAYNRFMEDWYIANGVREIHVYAAGGERWQGGFVWALNGFNWDGPERAESQLTYSLNRLRRMASSDVERSNIDYLLKKFNDAKTGGTVDLNKVPTPLEIAHVGWYPGAKEWIGKKHMINTTWEGVKRLDPKAKEQIQALNYDQMRAARKRLEAKENKAGVSREFSLTVNSNEFQNNNVELQPFLEDIRDVFTNNRSMAVLAPAAKAALNRFISTELLKKKEDRQVPFNDILQLRRVLDAEYAADHPNALPKDFGVGKDLISATLTQIETNNIPGFTVRELGLYESGYNTSYLVTHNDSGQVFYLKEDRYSDEYNINPVRAEVEAGVLARGLGLRGGYETRGNDNNEKIVIMQQAGAAIGLYGNPQNAYQVFSDGAIISSDDTLLRFDTREEFVDHLASPEDAIRIVLLDLLIDNTDRHNGNVLIAVDASDSRKLRLLPIDHSVAGLGRNTETNFNFEDVLDPGGNDNIYNRTMPVLTKRMSQDELLAIFRNQADRLRGELKNESLLPTGAELALIEKEWGSIDNYREVINSRLDMLLAPNGEMLPDMMDILKPGYWT